MFWAVAGAMSSAQLGITMAPAIRSGLIHGLSVTGANLEESLFRLVAHDHYRDFSEYRYFTKQDDTRILQQRMRRVTDTSIPEDEAFRAVETYILPAWRDATTNKTRRFWHEYFYEMVLALDHEAASRRSGRVLAPRRGARELAGRGPRVRGFDVRQHLRLAREARRARRRIDCQVGHRVHGGSLRSVPRALGRCGRRLLPDRRRHRRRLSDLRRAVASSTTSRSSPSRGATSARSPTRPRRTARTRAPRPTRRSPGTS